MNKHENPIDNEWMLFRQIFWKYLELNVVLQIKQISQKLYRLI